MSIVDWIYPRYCLGCRVQGEYFCPSCRRQVGHVDGSLLYTGIVRTALKAIKYRGTYDIVHELVDMWNPAFCEEYAGCVVTSVPMWHPKERLRGFNQAEMIAQAVARQWGLPYQTLLARTRSTKPMYGLTRVERAENMRGAFCTISSVAIPQRIILIDDVWTTGATMRACRVTLRAVGARVIIPITLARGLVKTTQ